MSTHHVVVVRVLLLLASIMPRARNIPYFTQTVLGPFLVSRLPAARTSTEESGLKPPRRYFETLRPDLRLVQSSAETDCKQRSVFFREACGFLQIDSNC